jgi:stearoyl-CoA desaturase (Delta-9 desaturase)
MLRPGDVIVFALLSVLTGLGVTVGFHRLFTHRSFRTRPAVRFILVAPGSAAIEGQVMSWVDDHRKHHAFSDRPGGPHSPHVDHGVGWRGALRGSVSVHAHVGWLFRHDQRGSRARYALWALGGLALAFGLGVVIGGSLTAGLTGLLQGKRARRQSDPARPLRTRTKHPPTRN